MMLVSTDHLYRRKAYRLAEPMRSNGARITYAPRTLCARCGYTCFPALRNVEVGSDTYHPGCAIKAGLLVPLAGHEWARLAGVAWA